MLGCRSFCLLVITQGLLSVRRACPVAEVRHRSRNSAEPSCSNSYSSSYHYPHHRAKFHAAAATAPESIFDVASYITSQVKQARRINVALKPSGSPHRSTSFCQVISKLPYPGNTAPIRYIGNRRISGTDTRQDLYSDDDQIAAGR